MTDKAYQDAALAFLPVALDLTDKTCLVVGSTVQAVRKAELLLKAGARVVIVDSATAEAFEHFHAGSDNNIQFLHRQFEEEDIDDKALVVAASGQPPLNELIARLAKKKNLPVNVVEDIDNSSLIFPSIINRNPLLISITSSGLAPVITRLLRNQLEASIPHGLGRLAELVGEFRNRVKKVLPQVNQRRRFWEAVVSGAIADLAYAGRVDKARQQIQMSLEDAGSISSGGEVYLVGAGPGDPDLLTFHALRLMRQADVVLYDRLVSEPILEMVRGDAEKINVGKARSKHRLPQQDINHLLVTLANEGKRVLRLKGGDPFIFGRGGEEIDQLADAGIPFQVVPGITAASGCASYSGIPLTHRDFSQSVRFVTGHLKNNSCDLPWQEFVHKNQTLVFYMGLLGLPLIVAQLTAHGMRKSMPVALVSRGTMPQQEVFVGTLATIVEQIEKSTVHGPTIIIIGEVVRLREKLNWLK